MFKNLLSQYLFLLFLLFSSFPSFAQNREGWEFLSWGMKMRQVQDSLTVRKIFYTYDLNEGKGAYIKFKIADYEAYEVNLFFYTENQLLYQVNTKRKFALKESQEAEVELERVVSALREAWGAPIKETTDKTAPFCQYEIVWELEKNLVSITYCKTSSISLTINYNKRS
jgi:hypothetical protein